MSNEDQGKGSIEEQKVETNNDRDNKNHLENKAESAKEVEAENNKKVKEKKEPKEDNKEKTKKEKKEPENNDKESKQDKDNPEEEKEKIQEKEEEKENQVVKENRKEGNEKEKENQDKETGQENKDQNEVNGDKQGDKPEDYVKGPGKAKQKTIKMDSEEDSGVATARDVVLQEGDQLRGPRIADIQKEKGQLTKTRSRRNIVHDGDDAYSYRNRGILQEVKWRPDQYAEKMKKLEKEKGLTVYEKVKMARKENPMMRKRIEDEMLSSRPSIEDMGVYLEQLRKQRKAQYYDDEDLYGSDDSDTESRMREIRRKPKPVPADKINETMEERRARIVRQMSEENERIDEIERKKEQARRQALRSTRDYY